MLSGKKLLTLSDGNFGVTDVNGNLMVLAILSSGRKTLQCFRGNSSDPRDHVFTAKPSYRTQITASFDVLLASNRRQDVADNGNWFEKRCSVFVGESTNIIAEVHKKQSVLSIAFGVDHAYSVRVDPNVEYAFIVALVAILNEINEEKCDDDVKK
ncbi:LURP1-like domain-containing protein, partial [Tanacetum coccineum]